jgi:hypothetical protein
MVEYFPWFIGGAALAGVPVLHWILLRRNLAVSGRFTAIVDRVRFGDLEEADMSQDEVAAAMRAATLEAFGEEALAELEASMPEPETTPQDEEVVVKARQDMPTHLIFLLGLILGGFVASMLFGTFEVSSTLRGDLLAKTSGGNTALSYVLLTFGGIFVGFGTRMSGGCTSGHGLCGVSRFQVASLAATAAFFGAGIAASLGLELLW